MTPNLMPAATTIGSLPGEDMGAALRLLLEQTPQVVAVPELPARGVGADMVGRSLGMGMMAADLQPAGWRLADHPGRDQRRARALLRQDLDQVEEQLQGFADVAKISVAGPWTLAALVELPRGERLLADQGACRELVASQAEGIADLLTELRRRLPQVTWWLQLDEPMLAMVHDGAVATASGYQRHRAVSEDEVVAGLARFEGLAVQTILHCCGTPPPGLLERLPVDALSVDVRTLGPEHLEALSAWLERGRRVWWGAVATWPADQLADFADDRMVLRRLVERLGLDPKLLLTSLVTPACGLASWSHGPARRAVRRSAELAEALGEQLGGA